MFAILSDEKRGCLLLPALALIEACYFSFLAVSSELLLAAEDISYYVEDAFAVVYFVSSETETNLVQTGRVSVLHFFFQQTLLDEEVDGIDRNGEATNHIGRTVRVFQLSTA